MVGKPGMILASAFSTFWLCVLMCPFDCLATRQSCQNFNLQGQGLLYKNFNHGAITIMKTEGFMGFYKGFTALLAR